MIFQFSENPGGTLVLLFLFCLSLILFCRYVRTFLKHKFVLCKGVITDVRREIKSGSHFVSRCYHHYTYRYQYNGKNYHKSFTAYGWISSYAKGDEISLWMASKRDVYPVKNTLTGLLGGGFMVLFFSFCSFFPFYLFF